MENSGQPKSTDLPPHDLLRLIRHSGVLSDRQFEEVRGKVRSGEYPRDSGALARRLIEERILTKFQADRLLRNKVHGLVVGRYVILDRLGAGARGRVFRAQHQLMGRMVALKVIAPQIASRASSIARFHREMRLIGRLDHPNVVRAFDADQIGDLLYIVMEYVPGRSLDHVVAERGSLSPSEVVNYMAQAALGLEHAHERGIVHRDVKPSNLLLSQEGQVKVLDLGLSALMEADKEASFATAAGLVVGTVHFMSPEQCAAIEIDCRSDLFSLGCTMYYLLTCQLPFPGDTLAECLALRIRGCQIPITDHRSDLSPRLVEVLDRLLARRPQDRFQTAGEAAAALHDLADTEASSSPSPRSTLLPPTAPSVPEPVVSSTLPSVVDSPATPSRDSLGLGSFSWFGLASILTAQPVVIVLLIVLLGLVAFGLGFALGRVSAIPILSGGR